MTQHPDTPTSQFTAERWTFYRRLGLLMRTRLLPDGTTLSLHEIASRTGGFVTADALAALLGMGARALPDALLCVKLAQAFDVDPDYFVSDNAVSDYLRTMWAEWEHTSPATASSGDQPTLQQVALALVARTPSPAPAIAAQR